MTRAERIRAWHARQQAMHPTQLMDGWPNPRAYHVRTGPIAGNAPRVTLGSGPVIVLGRGL